MAIKPDSHHDLIQELDKGYDLASPISLVDLPAQGMINETIGVSTGDGQYVLQFRPIGRGSEPLAYEHRLLRWLSRQALSFEVPVPVPTRQDITWHETAGALLVLSPRLDGNRPDLEEPTHIEAVGDALGELHPTLARYSTELHPTMRPYADLTQIHPQLRNPFTLTPAHLGLEHSTDNLALFAWWREALAGLHDFLEGTYPLLPFQATHGDYGPANTLVNGDQVSAVIDFEFALPDVRAIDVAAGLTFSMRNWERDDPWPMAGFFCKGYGQWVRLREDEIVALPQLMGLRDIVSAIYWLGRSLDEDKVSENIQRIKDVQRQIHWLQTNGERLVGICRRFCRE